MKVLLNNVQLTSVPGNLVLAPNTNTFGPYMDGRTYTEGAVRTKKGKYLGYYSKYVHGTKAVLKLTI